MDLLILLAVVAVSFGIIGFALLLRKLAGGPQTLPVTAEWIDELSVERYRPMLRLLSEDDLRFLASQPGYTSAVARRFRAQRCQIFRGYLRWLQSDFDRVCTALRLLMLHSQHDRPDLAAILLKERIAFTVGMFHIHVRLVFYRLGVSGVDVQSVMSAFDSLRVELRHMVPASVGAQV